MVFSLTQVVPDNVYPLLQVITLVPLHVALLGQVRQLVPLIYFPLGQENAQYNPDFV